MVQKHLTRISRGTKYSWLFCSLRSLILANYILPLKWALGVFQIWRFTNIMDNQFKISGWAFTVYGAIVVLAFMFAY
ncbi:MULTISPECIES: hypothetical protein, partial [unclassified Colwellia]|uniref:hypothetical protein n=1 Tax=unclassified Colwellia TaxID=196834 RepID=UPI001C70BBB2